MTIKTHITVNAPDSLKEEKKEITEQEAYAMAEEINKEDKDHEARVENGELKVQQVLKG